mgnify:CR=1 FL=1
MLPSYLPALIWPRMNKTTGRRMTWVKRIGAWIFVDQQLLPVSINV